MLPAEALTCERAGDTATCTAPVAGQPLTVALVYDDPYPNVGQSACTATYRDRTLSCIGGPGGDGHASDTAVIARPLDLTDDEVATLRAAVPWWHDTDTLGRVLLVLAVGLGILAGLAGLLLGPLARPLPPRLRVPAAVLTVGAGGLLYGAAGLVLAHGTHGSGVIMSASLIGLGPLAIGGWQLLLAGPPPGRARSALVAAGATFLFAGGTAFSYLLQGGFID